ncbi:MAG: prepilin-type N-terminal cleavage/methylation domain-containing protein [Candidatus Moraniibacteriota bacterium]|nr:MAG: prepilin-type N-terminal cleavage/methylation domain-containing protein [Candidatus Moranbacteria bacterium]
MMKIFCHNKKGISLIELLIYIAIMGILLTSIVSFITVNENMKKRNQAISEVEIQGWEAMRFITKSIKNAQSITGPIFGENSAVLTLVVDDVTKSPTIFDLNAGALRIKEGLSDPVTLTDSRMIVDTLSFTNFGSSTTKGSIKIQFNGSYFDTSENTDYQKTFYGTATPR